MFGWRWALRVTPALLVLLTVFAVPFVQDPARGASDGGITAVAGESASGFRGWWRDVTAVLKIPSMLAAIGGQAGCNFAIGAASLFVSVIFNRKMGREIATLFLRLNKK